MLATNASSRYPGASCSISTTPRTGFTATGNSRSSTGKPVAVILRPGKTPDGAEVALVLRHVIGRIRARWPAVEIVVRGDSHYGRPEAMAWCERQQVGYIFGLSSNPVLLRQVSPLAEDAALGRLADKGEKVRRYGDVRYGCGEARDRSGRFSFRAKRKFQAWDRSLISGQAEVNAGPLEFGKVSPHRTERGVVFHADRDHPVGLHQPCVPHPAPPVGVVFVAATVDDFAAADFADPRRAGKALIAVGGERFLFKVAEAKIVKPGAVEDTDDERTGAAAGQLMFQAEICRELIDGMALPVLQPPRPDCRPSGPRQP